MRRSFHCFRVVTALAAGTILGGCSGKGGDAASARCIANDTQTCACEGATSGVQVCADEGAYLPCICAEPRDSGGHVGADAATDAAGVQGRKGADGGRKDGSAIDGEARDGETEEGSTKVAAGEDGGAADAEGEGGSADVGPAFDGCAVASSGAIDGDQYIVQTNEWNSTLPQCLTLSGTGFTVTEADFALITAGPPASYPSIYKGCHWGDCTGSASSGMPILVSSAPTVTSSWSTTQPASGAYDVAYDIWFNSTPATTGQPDRAELMIWISERGGVAPAGINVAAVTLAGATWNVWTDPMASWNYIAYERTTTTTSVADLDIAAFINDAVTRGAISPSSYLIDVEAGFEIWQGGQGLATSSFSVDVGKGSAATCPSGAYSATCENIQCSSTSVSADCEETNGTLTATQLSLPCSTVISNCNGALVCGSCPSSGTCPLPGKSVTMIDDGSEAGTSSGILKQCGRVGGWYTFADPTSTQVPAAGAAVPFSTTDPPNGVTGYIETSGTLSNAALFGAGLGVDLYAPAGIPEDYDATQESYTGISFWVSTDSAPASQPVIIFQVLDAATAPEENGEYYFSIQIPPPPQGVWTKYSYTWSQLRQQISSETALDVQALRALQWQFNGAFPDTDTPQPFDVSIGDIEFTQ